MSGGPCNHAWRVACIIRYDAKNSTNTHIGAPTEYRLDCILDQGHTGKHETITGHEWDSTK